MLSAARIFVYFMTSCVSVRMAYSNLLPNGNFETLNDVHCSGSGQFRCGLIPADQSRFGHNSVRTYHRHPPTFLLAATRPLVTTQDGWVLLQGDFQAPMKAATSARFYFDGPEASVDFAVDNASVTKVTSNNHWRNVTDDVINRIRKSNIHVTVTAAQGIQKSEVQIQVLQKRKSFPFGTMVRYIEYLDPALHKYRDFAHRHFNWAVPGLSLKWNQLQFSETHAYYDRALAMIKGLKQHGLKVRGHNLVWSAPQYIPHWVVSQSGDQLRKTVRDHIHAVCNLTKGMLEHWDVNNENLHGQWFQQRLHDRDYDLQLFRITHQADPHPKLFLNDFGVVARGSSVQAYLAQARRFKAANVHLYGMGAQTHFKDEQKPNPTLIKEHLDTLAKAGVPIWATELDVRAHDENARADYYERALRSLYGHPAVDGIMFWGFWDQGMSAGAKGALVAGHDFHLTAAGRRVLDLLENEWMTDETRVLSRSGDQFNVRGFHGDYEVHVRYQGHDLGNLKQTFTLGKSDHAIHINVHT